MNAQLPVDLLEPTIAGMYPGSTAYTMSWALVVDQERKCWIRGDYPAEDTPGGTVKMEVHRNSDGFEVTIPKGEMYSTQAVSECEHRDWNLLPVTRLKC